MLKVALSPFFSERQYEDTVSGLVFEKGKYGEITTYDISNELKLDGVRNALRMNILILLDGEVPAPDVKAEKVETKVEAETKEPAAVIEEDVEAEEVTVVKPKTAKKK